MLQIDVLSSSLGNLYGTPWYINHLAALNNK